MGGRRVILVVASVGVAAAVLLVAMLVVVRVWIDSRPHWLLTTANTPMGFAVTITDTSSSSPFYVVRVKGGAIKTPTTRSLPSEVASPDVTTVFYDATIPPGRWTFRVNGTKVDVMPARIIVNDRIEGAPGSDIQVVGGT